MPMEQCITFVVLLIIMGVFVVKCWELLIALLEVIAHFAIPLAIGAFVCFAPKIIKWLFN